MVTSPLVLRVLGPVRLTGSELPLTSQQLAVVAYLACVGPARRESLIEAIWDGQRISDGRVANLVSDVRRVLGRRHFPEMVDHRYRVVDLATDLDLLDSVAGRGPNRNACSLGRSELAALEAAVGLVSGPVFATPPDRSWRWLDAHPEVVANAEASVGQVAHRLVTALAARGDLDRAREVCQRALGWCPLDRDLVLALEGLHRAQGRPAAAHRLVTRWRVQVERLTGEDPMVVPFPVGVTPRGPAGAARLVP